MVGRICLRSSALVARQLLQANSKKLASPVQALSRRTLSTSFLIPGGSSARPTPLPISRPPHLVLRPNYDKLSPDEIAKLRDAAKSTAPDIYLHSKDPFRPASAEWFLDKRASLWYGNARVLRPSEVNGWSIVTEGVSQFAAPFGSSDWGLRIEPDRRRLWSSYDRMEQYQKIDIPAHPTYYGQALQFDGNQKVCLSNTYFDINKRDGMGIIRFFGFYPYNGGMFPITVGSIPGAIAGAAVGGVSGAVIGSTFDSSVETFNAHEGDWEHVSAVVVPTGDAPIDPKVQLHKQNLRIGAKVGSAHGNNTWAFEPNNLESDGFRALKMFSAFHSHALYPSPGQHLLLDLVNKFPPDLWGVIDGLGNLTLPGLVSVSRESFFDHCNQGVLWPTRRNLIDFGHIKKTPWQLYAGQWGTTVEVSPNSVLGQLAGRIGGYPARTSGPTGPKFKGFDIPFTRFSFRKMPMPAPKEGTDYQVLGPIDVHYRPQGDQNYRCSADFPNWHVEEGMNLFFSVDVGQARNSIQEHEMPKFNLLRNRSAPWYQLGIGTKDIPYLTGVTNGAPIAVNSDLTDTADGIYIGPAEPLPAGIPGSARYTVTVYATRMSYADAYPVDQI